MNITIDISAIPYHTGVSRYTANLTRALYNYITTKDHLHTFSTSFRQSKTTTQFVNSLPPHPHSHLPFPPKLTSLLFHTFNLPIDTFIPSTSIFHTWDWYLPRSQSSQVVMTVHDIALFKFPHTAHQEIRRHHQTTLVRAHRYQTPIIAVSSSTKDDLINTFHLESDRITVIPEALPLESQQLPDPQTQTKIINKFSFTKPYLLIVGTREPRKNIPRMIRAWKKFSHKYHLVIVGKPGWETISPEPGLIIIDSANQPELATLYHHATLLLYASLYEGFGLPILEAFHHQIPVVTSDCSSMPQVAGKAAIIVNPYQVKSIAEGIQTALDHAPKLISQGNARLKQFSWEKTAVQTLNLYHQVAQL